MTCESSSRRCSPSRDGRPSCSDIDGTLAPIVATPEQAAVPPETLSILETLCGSYSLVACVTGRQADPGTSAGAGRVRRHLWQPRARGDAGGRGRGGRAGGEVPGGDPQGPGAGRERRADRPVRLPHRGQGHHLHHPLPQLAAPGPRRAVPGDPDRAEARPRRAGMELRPHGVRGAAAGGRRQGHGGQAADAAAAGSTTCSTPGTTAPTWTHSARRPSGSRCARARARPSCSRPPTRAWTGRPTWSPSSGFWPRAHDPGSRAALPRGVEAAVREDQEPHPLQPQPAALRRSRRRAGDHPGGGLTCAGTGRRGGRRHRRRRVLPLAPVVAGDRRGRARGDERVGRRARMDVRA